MKLQSSEIHALINDRWPEVLMQLGVDERYLTGKHGPCPVCGGRDRFRFDNKWKRGNWICTHCGSGDGFEIVKKMRGISFAAARGEVLRVTGFDNPMQPRQIVRGPRSAVLAARRPARPSRRVHRLLKETCEIERCPSIVEYLKSRKLWPLIEGHRLRAHPGLQYWDPDAERVVGYYPSLLAEVRDLADELVTVSVTWTENGRKLSGFEPRKMLSGTTGRSGCAVRIWPATGETLGIAEGIETAIAACRLFRIPTWAALSASLLAKFEPPSHVKHLVVFADHDRAGIKAATKLRERLQGRLSVAITAPPREEEDWADVQARVGDTVGAEACDLPDALTL